MKKKKKKKKGEGGGGGGGEVEKKNPYLELWIIMESESISGFHIQSGAED